MLWGDGAEIGRAVIAALAVAAWLVGFIMALNWYNKQRQQQVADIIRQLPVDPWDVASENPPGPAADGSPVIDPRSTSRPDSP